jgi:hypothetical protein
MDNTNFACVHDKFSKVADYFTSVAAAIMIFNPHLFDRGATYYPSTFLRCLKKYK